MEIRTDRLVLRDIADSDLVAFHNLQSDPQVTRYTKQGPNKNLDQSQQMLDDVLLLTNAERSYESHNQPVLILAITVAPSQELIGMVGTFRPREIGFSLHPDFWGKGIAQEATKAFCSWYVKKYPEQQLFAKVNKDNEASLTCLRRCGFSVASEIETRDHEIYSKDKTRETWLWRGMPQ